MKRYSPSKLQSIIESQGRRVYWLAEQAEVHPTTIYRFLRNERGLSEDAAQRIAQMLDVSPDSFVCEGSETAATS